MKKLSIVCKKFLLFCETSPATGPAPSKGRPPARQPTLKGAIGGRGCSSNAKYFSPPALYLLLAFIALSITATAQISTSQKTSLPAQNITELKVSVHWGQIKIEPATDARSIDIYTRYDNAAKKNLQAGASRLITEVEGQRLLIASPKPAQGTFESYDLTIRVPVNTHLKLEMKRGGEISVQGIAGSMEIDNQNGSTSVEDASSWLTVNNFNGEIKVSYADLSQVEAISLITFNGGITLSTPSSLNAEVVLQTKKNGFIRSDFPVRSPDGKQYVNMARDYEAKPNQWQGRIGKGGTKIIAITNNGPVEVRRN
jgi:DUF4097 and DUF4098 domain-containing protein YvlB